MFGIKKEYTILASICFFFFIAYSLLSVIRHLHFGSFGYDLGIADQTVWEYSKLKIAIATIDHVPFTPELFGHLEFIYILLAPFYWIYDNVVMLILLQVLAITLSGIPIFFLAKKHGLNRFLSFVLLISYLSFYGVQNALWFDVHSAVFGASFLAWFIYFLDRKLFYPSVITFFLTVICKENFAAMTLLISLVYFLYRYEKRQLIFICFSSLYLFLVFGLYYPHFVPGGYRFQSHKGLLGGISILDFLNTSDKRIVIGYTFAWTGFLSLLQPLFLLPLIGNLFLYFTLGRDVTTAQGLFLQYRIELAPLLFLATIYGIKKIKKINSAWIGVYLLFCTMLFQYMLHLPLSYLTKAYFWKNPTSERSINSIISLIPGNAKVVAQNNIIPHVSQRTDIYTLWPSKKDFPSNSPCNAKTCDWFSWVGNPKYLIVDISTDWDIRHLLANREDFIKGLSNLEKADVITIYEKKRNTILYKINKNP